jgi:23S rRNA G2445 N2-methylase RlmL
VKVKTAGSPGDGSLRLVGIPGTNRVMAGELSRLAGRAFDRRRLPAPKKEGQGTLVYPFDLSTAALAVRYHRTCSRVLWSLFGSRAARLEPLYKDFLASLAREPHGWLEGVRTFSISPVNLGGFAAGERQVVGAVKNALIEGAGRRGVRLEVDAAQPDINFEVRMHDDEVTLSIDLAGGPMGRRGYRASGGTAPLRENLAAVLVMLARHDARGELLLDPMAGSGTIAIEAVKLARGEPVWPATRQPAARRLAPFAGFLEGPAEPLFADTRPLAIAGEVDGQAHALSRGNTARAGVAESVENWRGDFRQLDRRRIGKIAESRGLSADRGVILSNPPYGERLDGDRLTELYRDLGHWCGQFTGWRAAFLVANPAFESAFGGRPRIKKPLRNGPLRGYFYMYDL